MKTEDLFNYYFENEHKDGYVSFELVSEESLIIEKKSDPPFKHLFGLMPLKPNSIGLYSSQLDIDIEILDDKIVLSRGLSGKNSETYYKRHKKIIST